MGGVLAVSLLIGCGGDSADGEDEDDAGGASTGGTSGNAGDTSDPTGGAGASTGGTSAGGTSAGGTGGTSTGGTAGTVGLGGSAGVATGGSAGTATGGMSGSGGTGVACNDLEPSTRQVTYALGPDIAPSPMGGALTAGVYHLDTLTVYGATDSTCLSVYEDAALRYTVEILPDSASAGTIEILLTFDGGISRGTLDYTLSGNAFLTTPTCGVTAEDDTPYTSTQSTLTLFGEGGGVCGTVSFELVLE